MLDNIKGVVVQQSWSVSQYGFRAGRSTMDRIFTLRQISEKAQWYNKDACMLLIDFRQTYDSIHRVSLIKVAREMDLES